MKRAHSPSERDSSSKSITLGEHIDSIITKDFNRSSYPVQYHVPTEGALLSFVVSAMSYDDSNDKTENVFGNGILIGLSIGVLGLSMAEQHNWKMRRTALSSKDIDVAREGPADKGDERQIIRIAQSQTGASKPYHEPVSPPEQWGGRYTIHCFVKNSCDKLGMSIACDSGNQTIFINGLSLVS